MFSPKLVQLKSKHPFVWVMLLLGIVALSCYVAVAVEIYHYGGTIKSVGFTLNYQADGVFVDKVATNGAAVGRLAERDRVLALNGIRELSKVTGSQITNSINPPDKLTVLAARGDKEFTVELTPEVKADARNWPKILSCLAVSLAFFLVSLAIGFLKPDEWITRLAAISSYLTALALLSDALELVRPLLPLWAVTLFCFLKLIDNTNLAVGYHFYHRFPPDLPRRRAWTALQYIIYAVAAVLLLCKAMVSGTLLVKGIAGMGSVVVYGQIISSIIVPFILLTYIGNGAVIIHNYLLVKEPDQQRRNRWIVLGSAAGILPGVIIWMAVVLLDIIGYRSEKSAIILDSLVPTLFSLLIPLTTGYAIIKHRVFDINFIIRRGVKYLMAKNGLRIAMALPLLGTVYNFYIDRNLTLVEIISRNSINFYLLCVSLVAIKFHRQLSELIDKRFFRTAYTQEKVLSDLVSDLKGVDTVSEISRLVCKQLDAALKLKAAYIFYRDDESLTLTLSHTIGEDTDKHQLQVSQELFQALEGQAGTIEYPFAASIPASELEWLQRLKIGLIIPMCTTDARLIGLIMLGEKKSEEPYSDYDKQLLMTLASQMALMYENALLKSKVTREEKIKRDVLSRFDEQNINILKECPRCGRCYDRAEEKCQDGSKLTFTLPVERVIERRYRLDRLIGRGGMGAVYEAMDLRLNRLVAIKVMLGNKFGDQEALRRFEQEAQTSARLNHPNITAVFDFGTIGLEGAFLVMERLTGVTMKELIKRNGGLPTAMMVDCFEQLFTGVKAAHQAGIIHRDLKPDNVLVVKAEDGREIYKVLDFGLAKVRRGDINKTDSFTTPGTVMGTLGYMSPEQLSGERVDERSDIYALGVMIIEAITGRRPFRGTSMEEFIVTILTQTYTLPGNTKEARLLNDAIQRCIAKNPANRYENIDALYKEMIPALRAYCATGVSAAPASAASNTGDLSQAITRLKSE